MLAVWLGTGRSVAAWEELREGKQKPWLCTRRSEAAWKGLREGKQKPHADEANR